MHKLKARNRNLRAQQACPSAGPEGESLPCPPCSLVVACDHWHFLVNDVFFLISVTPSHNLLVRTRVTGFRTYPTPSKSHHNCFVSKDPVSKQNHTLGSWEDMDFMGGGHYSLHKGSFSSILGSGNCKDVLKEEDTTIARRDLSKAHHSQEPPQSRSPRGSKRESGALFPYPGSLPPASKHDIEPSQESRL